MIKKTQRHLKNKKRNKNNKRTMKGGDGCFLYPKKTIYHIYKHYFKSKPNIVSEAEDLESSYIENQSGWIIPDKNKHTRKSSTRKHKQRGYHLTKSFIAKKPNLTYKSKYFPSTMRDKLRDKFTRKSIKLSSSHKFSKLSSPRSPSKMKIVYDSDVDEYEKPIASFEESDYFK